MYNRMCYFNKIRYIYSKIRVKCNNYYMLYRFEMFEYVNLYDILYKLCKKEYEFSKYHIFLISEPKYRLIMSEGISDKIVNHLISFYILIPCLEKKLIDLNVATRKEMGSGKALEYLKRYLNTLMLNKREIYILKIDIKKYFYNIDHEILINKLKKDIKDKDVINLIEKIINMTNYDYVNKDIEKAKNNEIKRVLRLKISDKEKSKKIYEINKIPFYKKGKGLGIGNMTSQIFAVYYLNSLDHYIKEELKFKYYIRYMDDLVILDYDKERLVNAFKLIKEKINELKLETNDKSRLYNLNHGFSFLGYTFKSINGKLSVRINNGTYRRLKKNLKSKKNKDDYHNSLVSYKGLFLRCSSKMLYKKLIRGKDS